MNKLLFLLFASILVLSACGDNEKKEEPKKETKSKEKQEKEVVKKPQKQEEQQQVQTVEQPPAQTVEQPQQPVQHEPTKEEIYEWDKQNIPGGTDAGLIDYDDVDAYYSNDQLDPDTGLPREEEIPHKTE